jgi:hypothetical protein
MVYVMVSRHYSVNVLWHEPNGAESLTETEARIDNQSPSVPPEEIATTATRTATDIVLTI